MPKDLWRARSVSFFTPTGSSSAISASVTCTMSSPTISQCSSCETAPQRSVVFRRPMRAKLMRVNAACKLRALGAALSALLLGGCPLPTRAPAPSPAAAAPRVEAETPAPHEGAPYDVIADESLLVIRAYRGGALASAGHNHVIASHSLSGTVYVPGDLRRASFEIHVPVAELSVDEAALREREGSADFPPEVPEAARQGTLRNMLGAALLDGEHHDEIVLRSLRLEHDGRVHRDRAVELRVVPVAARDRMDVAVEHESDELPLGVDQRAARVAAHDVVAGREIEGRLRIELRPQRKPAVGNAEGLLARGALEQARESSEGLDLAAVLLPALHGAEVETQREGGIRGEAGAVGAEAGAGDLLGGGLDGGLDLILVALPQRAGFAVDAARELDHRVVRGVDPRCAAVPQAPAERRIGALRPVPEPCGQRVGGVAGQQRPHDRGVRPEPLAHALEPRGAQV